MFTEDSQLVKSIIKLIDSGKMKKEDVKPFYNLKEVIEKWYQK